MLIWLKVNTHTTYYLSLTSYVFSKWNIWQENVRNLCLRNTMFDTKEHEHTLDLGQPARQTCSGNEM